MMWSQVRRALDSMGCFRDIGVFIDVSSGPGATPEGLEASDVTPRAAAAA